MWDPTCLGDPGKVSDAEYKCSTDDSGGVHSNSGVREPRLLAARGRRHLQRGGGPRHRPHQGGARSSGARRRPTSDPTSDFQDHGGRARRVVRRPDRGAASTRSRTEPMDQRRLGGARSPLPTARRSRPSPRRWSSTGSRPSATSSPCSAANAPSSCGERFRSVTRLPGDLREGSRATGRRRSRSCSTAAAASPGARPTNVPRSRQQGCLRARPRTRATAPAAPATSRAATRSPAPQWSLPNGKAWTPRLQALRRDGDGRGRRERPDQGQRRRVRRSSRPRRTSSTRRRP